MKNRGHSASLRQRGYVLFTVVVMLVVVAAGAFLVSYDSSLKASMPAGEAEASRAEYVVEAAMQHALWQSANNACMGNVTVPTTALGSDSYTVAITGAATGTAYTLTADQDAWIRNDDVTKNNGTTAEQHIKFEFGNVEHALTRFDLSSLPADAQINSATAWFYISPSGPSGGAHPEGPLTVHRVTANWTETGATWETMNGNFESSRLATIPAQSDDSVWISINLTGQVQAWVNGQPNYGVLMASNAEGVHGKYSSREDGSYAPRLEVVVGSGTASPVNIQATGTLVNGTTRTLSRPLTAALQPRVIHTLRPDGAESEDAEIWAQAVNNNYGDAVETWVSSASNDTTRSLLRFNLGAIPTQSRVLEATLSLRRRSGSGSDQPISAHRITNSWSEDSVTWSRRESGTSWDTAGGDFDSQAITTTPVGPANQRYEWSITPLVQSWVDGNYPNYGVAMVAAIDGLAGERFYTSDQAIGDRRPSLSVTYACECGSACTAPNGSGNVLMPVTSTSNPSSGELVRIALLESWGYVVNTTWQWNSQPNFDFAIAANDVVYVPATVVTDVGSKLANASIGVISEHGGLNSALGIASGSASPVGSAINISDNSHYITLPFAAGSLNVYSAAMEGLAVAGTPAPGLQALGDWTGSGGPVVLDTGATKNGGGTAAGRRVLLPIGGAGIDFAHVNNNGLLIVQRALAWGMNADATGPVGNLLLVVINPTSLTSAEQAKKTLIESWSYSVTLIDDGDSQASFDTALAANDVVYVSGDVSAATVGTKLTAATIGIVNEETLLTVELGFSDDIGRESRNEIEILDNTHSITSGFALGMMTIVTSMQPLTFINNGAAPGAQVLAQTNQVAIFFEPSLLTLETGSELAGGGFAAGKRVSLPWGDSGFDINALNANGQTIMERAIEWAASADGGAGSGNILISTDSNATLGGLTFTDKDLAEYDSVNNTATLFFDGVAAALAQDIDALHVLANDHIVLSAINTITLGGVTSENEDLIDYDPVTDLATIMFDGSALFTSGSTDISAVHVLDNGHLLLTNEYSATLGGQSFGPNDIVDYDPGTDTATLFFDGDAVGFSGWINAVHLLANGNLVLSTNAANTLGGLGLTEDDLVEYNIDADTATLYFDGALFSASENVRSVHIGAGSGGPSGPIAYWKLDETSGTMAVDSVGGHDGTLLNMDPSTDWVPGHLSGGLNFDGSNDYIDVSSMNPMSYDDFTVSAWYKSADLSVSDDEYIFEHNDNFTNEITFGPTDDGANDRLRFGFSNGGSGTWDPHYGTSDIVDQQWHHVVGVRSAGRIKIYVDGALESDGADAHAGSTVVVDGDGPFIGDLPGNTEQVHGILDDVRLYDRGLSDAEIANLFTAGGGGGGGGGGPDANFGFDEIFSSSQRNVRRKQIATQVTLPEDGTATSITAYVGDQEDHVRYAIYTDAAGEPGALLAESGTENSPGAIDWFKIDIPETALAAGTYWLALSFNHRDQIYHYEGRGQTRYNNNRATGNGYTATWGSSSASHTRKISIYATYTPD